MKIKFSGSLWPSLMVEPKLESRMYPWSNHVSRIIEESGYFHIQATKPDTVGKLKAIQFQKNFN